MTQGSDGLEATIELLDGEVIIKPDGLYTKIHFYKHPSRDLEVVLVGDNHVGTEGYVEALKSPLNVCDLVLHEASYHEEEEEYPTTDQYPITDQLRELSQTDLTQAFLQSTMSFFYTFSHMEGVIVNNNDVMIDKDREDKWIPVDPLSDKDDMEMIWKEFECSLLPIDDAKKSRIMDYMISKIERIQAGTFELREYGDAYVILYGKDGITNVIMSSAITTSRDPKIIEGLQYNVDSRPDIGRVGMFYGALHFMGMRPLMEEHGYTLVKTLEVKAINF